MDTGVEDIKSKLNIVDVIGSYLRLQKSGAHWKAPCPFHNEKTPSFLVNEERQIWHCFGCNKGGDMFTFLMEWEGMDFREALKVLAQRAGVELRDTRSHADNGGKQKLLELLEWATKFYEKQLWDGVGNRKALPYLRERAISDSSVRDFRLGYAPSGWRNLSDFLIGRGYSAEEIERAGLAIRKENGGHYDRFRDRILFPITDTLGRVIGYSARVLPGSDESQAKYINTPETSVYQKSSVLYGLARAKQKIKEVGFSVLVEGNMDVIAAHQSGFSQTVAVSGTALTQEQLKILKRYADTIKLFFDMDGAGQNAARRSAELALSRGFSVEVISVSQGKDAADIAREDPELLRQAIKSAAPALQYFLDQSLLKYDRRVPDGKRKIVEEYMSLLRFSIHEIDRVFWTRKLAEALDVEEKILLNELQKKTAAVNGSPADFREVKTGKPAVLSGDFARRSEILREKIIGILLQRADFWEQSVRNVSGTGDEFLKQSPIGALVFARGEEFGFSFDKLLASIPENDSLRQIVTALYFEGERAREGFLELGETARTEAVRKMLDQYRQDLKEELLKEQYLRLERAMKEARERGDAKEEKRLLLEFQALTQGGSR